MKARIVKILLWIGCSVLAFVLWFAGIWQRGLFTPLVSLSELTQKGNCDKFSKVSGRVAELIGDRGYILDQDGARARVAVGKVKRGLPAVGDNIYARVYVNCHVVFDGRPVQGVRVLETSRSWSVWKWG